MLPIRFPLENDRTSKSVHKDLKSELSSSSEWTTSATEILLKLKKRLPDELSVPGGWHYLSFWKNHLLLQDILEPTHLNYQESDAFIEMCLRYPNPTPARLGWKTWPTLATFVQNIGATFSRRAVKLFLGSHVVGNNTLDGLKTYADSVNHPGPAASTLDTWKPPLQLISGPNHLTTLLHLKIMIQQPGSVPHLRNEKVTRFPGVLCYDEQEINQGVFPVEVDGQLNLAGLAELIPVEEINTETLTVKLRSDPKYKLISAARAFRFADYGDFFSSPNYISYIAGAQKHEEITENLEDVVEWVTSCMNCMEKGKTCNYTNLLDPCSACSEEKQICYSFAVFQILSDKYSAQVSVSKNWSAIIKLSSESLFGSRYIHDTDSGCCII
ncbi:hypothetical protein ACHWQZ_G010909 [Mnemiopsis leidyi]